jgi:N-acyl-D-amino-acid deacylase
MIVQRLVFGLLVLAQAGVSCAGDDDVALTRATRQAIDDGLAVVQRAAANYPKNAKCFSCHHQTLPLLAMKTAAERGIKIDEAVLESQAEFTLNSFHGRQEGMRKGRGIGGKSMTVGYGLWTLDLAEKKRDETTRAMVAYLLARQEDDGRWVPQSIRPPLEESNVMCTALAGYYMQKFAAEGQQDDVAKAVSKAISWLRDFKCKTQEDNNAKLWGLSLFDQDDTQRASVRNEIIAAQLPDGGWGQLTGMGSDAYATGQTLYFLQQTGTSTNDHIIKRGVQFLIKTQHADGSWFVKSRSKPVQRYFDNGDPHGTDQFISTPATCWAVAALASSLPREH